MIALIFAVPVVALAFVCALVALDLSSAPDYAPPDPVSDPPPLPPGVKGIDPDFDPRDL